MFVAGMPLMESMKSVAGATGNWIYHDAILEVQQAVHIDTSLISTIQATHMLNNMVLQVTQTGEESSALDNILLKAVEFYEHEVDDAVANISTLTEPIIIVFLGVLIGGMVVAMHLPIFEFSTVI